MSQPRTIILFLLVILLITGAVLIPILGFDFNVATDDYFFVLQNSLIKDTSVAGFLKVIISTGPRYNDFQPMAFLSYWVDYALFGLRPAGYYATQIILHLINASLVFIVVRSITGNDLLALLTCLIFALHPIQVDTVAMINQRKTLLATMFSLLSIRSYIQWQKTRFDSTYATAVVCFLLALLSKSTAVVLPVLLILVEYSRTGRLCYSALFRTVPFFLLAALFSLITILTVTSAGHVRPYHFGSLMSQALLIVLIYSDYLFCFIVPINLSPAYSYSPMEILSWRMVAAAAVLFLWLGFLAIAIRKKWRSITFGLLWFTICMVPTSQIIPTTNIRADHYMYQGLMGLALIVSAGIVSIMGKEKERARKFIMPVVAALVVVLAPITLNHFGHYSTPVKYYERFVHTQGWSPSAEAILARVYNIRGENELAEKSYKKAIDHFLEPIKSSLRMELARVYIRAGRLDDALAQLDLVPPDSPANEEIVTLRKIIDKMKHERGSGSSTSLAQ
jgi:protein O-mannosyl-transferase